MVNNRSFNFDNPLVNTSHYIQAVRSICDNAEIINRVVFTSKSSFPKGIPEGVVELKNLRKELESLRGASINSGVNSAKGMWDRLLESTRQQKIQYKQELSNAA